MSHKINIVLFVSSGLLSKYILEKLIKLKKKNKYNPYSVRYWLQKRIKKK